MVSSEAQIISKESKSSFYYAFNLLPAAKREAMNIIYAFCRKTDDIVDEQTDQNELKHRNLVRWRSELERAVAGQSEFQLLNKTSQIIRQFRISPELLFELIKGMEMDLVKVRYQNFDELRQYCYRVASTVGLMCIEIFGYKNESAKEFAENLGIALQLTNIIRDVGEDAKNGRIYIPLDELEKFGYSEKELLDNTINHAYINLMTFQAERAKTYFRKATDALTLEDKPSMFAARAMQHIYYRVLKRIVEAEYNVFNEKIRLNTFEKVGISVGVWAKYQLVYK